MRLLLLLMLYIINPALPDIDSCRHLLDRSLNDKKVADEFYRQMKNIEESDAPVMVGFRAMSELMLSKHLLNPFSKLSHFNKGRALLEAAITRAGDDPELLFFRLSTQSNVPSLLHYNKDIGSDKGKLIGFVKSGTKTPVADKVLYKRIKAYLLVNQYCTAAEKAIIKNL